MAAITTIIWVVVAVRSDPNLVMKESPQKGGGLHREGARYSSDWSLDMRLGMPFQHHAALSAGGAAPHPPTPSLI